MPDSLVVRLADLDRTMLDLAGGKAVNLGELLHGGFHVPEGVCVTTRAYALMAETADLAPLVNQLAAASTETTAKAAHDIREAIVHAELPQPVVEEIRAAVATLGTDTRFAVRSSATAEDLPFASFAGQQDTYLNVTGAAAILEAVRRCWASLWNERAVAYRASNNINPSAVSVAVVIQIMVDAAFAGVLFTVDPLSGNRGHSVIEAVSGLGESLVSGAANPDHYVVDVDSARILDTRAPAATLSQAQVIDIARTGKRVERHFGAPQDIEFAIDRDNTLWLVQSRAITTLFPLPSGVPTDQRNLRVYLSFNTVQGVFRPLTPLGIDAFRLLGISLSALFGIQRTTPVLSEAAGRLYMDVTTAVRWLPGRRLLRSVLEIGESRSGALLDSLTADPRLAPRRANRRALARALVHLLRSTQLPLRIVWALLSPSAARRECLRLRRAVEREAHRPIQGDATRRIDEAEQLLLVWPPRILPSVVPAVLAGVGSFALAERLLGPLALRDERDAVRRALPDNPTTEMDLALWAIAQRAAADPCAAEMLRNEPPEALVAAYHDGSLPATLQAELHAFLVQYGHRAIAEIDLGLPRWSDDPSPVISHLAGYQALGSAHQSAEAQFRTAADDAQRVAATLVERAKKRSRLRGMIVGLLLRRGRKLAGFRELPKYVVVLLLARARQLALSVGYELAAAGRVEHSDDVFFLTFPELRDVIGGSDVRTPVAERRARYSEELRRRHVPRLLLSDGTEPKLAAAVESDARTLRGAAASAGRVSGRARVVLDPTGARLEPGEILVAPSTDPGWTPLFMTAAGLVMEMGGAMSHGAVVAREYGIPAVVGLAGATERITDGAVIEVDGGAGTVTL